MKPWKLASESATLDHLSDGRVVIAVGLGALDAGYYAFGEITKRLAAWATIFSVCTAFAGIWCMNSKNMPEMDWRYGYAIALALIVGCCGFLYYRFRRAGWV